MRSVRLIAVCLLAVALGACQRQHPMAPAAPAAAPPPPPASGAPADAGIAAEGPRILLSPDNVHIEYNVYGAGQPTVILVHGWAENANYWQAQIEPLKSAHYTVVTLNLAGHGASGNNRSDWSIANYAQDVAAVARQLPPGPLVLVGHSMGASVVLAATPVIGPRVIGLVVVEALRSAGEPPLPAREIERRVAPFSADFVGATRRLVSESLFEKGADPLLLQKVAYDMSLARPAVAVPSMRALLSWDLNAVLPQIHVPVYVINSDLAPTDAARIHRVLPRVTLDVLPHISHFPMLEVPARFNPLLLKDVAAIAQQQPH
jgi:pimeloyl-ACP methyl ester carboxylesterase